MKTTHPRSFNGFDSIIHAVQKATKSSQYLSSNFLKFEPNKTYLVRLLPFYKDPSLTLFRHLSHHFRSKVDGTLVNLVCPNTFDMKCPIDEYRAKVYATKNEQAIKEIAPLSRAEYWWVNVWVWKDPTNPENENTVKIMRASKRLFKVIREAIDGEDAELYGPAVFETSEEGFDLRIRSEASADKFPDYSVSRFVQGSKEVPLSVEELAEKQFNFVELVPKPDPEEVEKIFHQHWFGAAERERREEVEEDYTSSPVTVPSFSKSQQIFENISAGLKKKAEIEEFEDEKEFLEDTEPASPKKPASSDLKVPVKTQKSLNQKKEKVQSDDDFADDIDISDISDTIDDILNKIE